VDPPHKEKKQTTEDEERRRREGEKEINWTPQRDSLPGSNLSIDHGHAGRPHGIEVANGADGKLHKKRKGFGGLEEGGGGGGGRKKMKRGAN